MCIFKRDNLTFLKATSYFSNDIPILFNFPLFKKKKKKKSFLSKLKKVVRAQPLCRNEQWMYRVEKRLKNHLQFGKLSMRWLEAKHSTQYRWWFLRRKPDELSPTQSCRRWRKWPIGNGWRMGKAFSKIHNWCNVRVRYYTGHKSLYFPQHRVVFHF